MADDRKKEAKKRRVSAKARFHRIYNALIKDIDEEVEVVDKMLEDLEVTYHGLEEKHEKYLEELLSAEEDDRNASEAATSDMDKNYRELCHARKVVVKKKASNEEKVKPIYAKGERTLQVKKLSIPTFSGNIREYPTFKHDYEKHMMSVYGEDPFALRSCLSGEAELIIHGADDNYREMFKRLDQKYGCPEKLIDSVMGELRKIQRVSDNDPPTKFIKLVEVIERCWLDLCKMDMSAEMDTTIMMSQIEKLLPPLQRREWALLRQKSSASKCKFPDMLKFLIDEKNALEYISDEIRKPVESVRGRSNNVEVETKDESMREMVASMQGQMEFIIKGLSKVVEAGAYLSQVRKNNGEARSLNFDPNGGTKGRCWIHNTDTHDILSCDTFNSLDAAGRVDRAKQQFICFCCLKYGHTARRCYYRSGCPVKCRNGQICGKPHHEKLHLENNHIGPTYSYHNKYNHNECETNRENVLLMVSEVMSGTKKLSVLWDPGANVSLISKDAAKYLNLKGKNVTLSITKVGNVTENISSLQYILPLIDMNDKLWNIPVYEIEDITAEIQKVDLSDAVKLFSDITENYISRPSGKVHVLIGLDWCDLMPEKIAEVGNLQLMENPFGLSIRGSHPSIKSGGDTVVNNIKVNIGFGRSANGSLQSLQFKELTGIMEKFMDLEVGGIEYKPMCGGCKCGTCLTGSRNCSIKEEREMMMIKKGLTLNQEERCWYVIYPWVKDPTELPNNYKAVVGRLYSTERRLLKMGNEYSKMYDNQIKDMIDRGAARMLEKREIALHKGPCYYVPHHEVVKPASVSTPMRIVFNSSAHYMGHVLNDYWAKGPNTVNDMIAVLLRFRQHAVAFIGDIKKMYNAIKLSKLDQHTHRFLWRNMNTSREPDHYVLTSVTFGDRPSGAIATTAMQMTADMFRDKYPEAADIIKNNSYVDDLLASVSHYDKANTLMRQIDELLDYGGFHIKHWITSNECKEKIDQEFSCEIMAPSSEKVLGVVWSPDKDVFRCKVEIVSNTKDSETNDVVHYFTKMNLEIVTPRMAVSLLARVYDPLGLVIPQVLEGKLLLRRTFSSIVQSKLVKEINSWDVPLDGEIKGEWINFFKELFKLGRVEFNRCLKPSGCIDEPELVIFADASQMAYGVCGYVRWPMSEGGYKANLIIAKNRIAPKRKLTVPRLELCAAVIASRLRVYICKEMNYKFKRVIHLTDSMIVRDQIQNECCGFKTFTAVRIAEIQENSEPSEWFWIPSNENPADLTTRITDLTNPKNLKFWKYGPQFLNDHIECWPINTESTVRNKDLPDRININLTSAAEKETFGITNIMKIDRFSSYNKLINVTCILIAILQRKSFKLNVLNLKASLFNEAEMCWIKCIQSECGAKWEKHFRRLGPQRNINGLITVGKRLSEWFGLSWNRNELILLPYKHRYTYLYVAMIHQEDHSLDGTISRVRSKYWVPKLTQMVKKIRSYCITCRKRDKRLLSQEMGPLPLERLMPSPPFYNCGIDLFGPIIIKDNVKGRCRGKGYGVLFNCLSSRAVYIDVTDAYHTDAFLLCLRRFISIHGFPRKIVSDNGSQLIGASKELTEISGNWDWRQILQAGRENNLDWEFTKSADAPWENGCSESLIRLTKRNIMLSVGSYVFTLNELQTIMFEIGNLLNQRPIGVKSLDTVELTHLCPNDLLLGRASPSVPSGNFDEKINPRKRYEFTQKITNSFWSRWQKFYFSTLLVRQKWHTSSRNVCVGDIMLLQDSNAIRGCWRLVEVCEANPGKDGKVRDVKVRYKPTSLETKYSGVRDIVVNRSVHRLVLILPIEERHNAI